MEKEALKPIWFFLSFITFLGLFFLNLNRIGDVRFAGQSNTASDLEPWKNAKKVSYWCSNCNQLKKISLASQRNLWLSMQRKTNQCIIKYINFAIHLTPYLDLNNKVSFIDQPIRTVQIKVNSGLLGRMDSQGQMFVVVSFRTKVIWWHGNGLELLQDLCYFIETSPIHALVIL